MCVDLLTTHTQMHTRTIFVVPWVLLALSGLRDPQQPLPHSRVSPGPRGKLRGLIWSLAVGRLSTILAC